MPSVRALRLLPHGVAALFVLATAAASCSSPKQYDDDDDGGSSGERASGGSSATSTGGSSKGGKGSGATGAGGTPSTGGSVADGGSATGATGGVESGGGTPSTGGTGGNATGGDGASGGDLVASGGANDAGAAGACAGADCNPCTGTDCPAAPVCGDLKIEGSESCDDGNAVSFDGCSATCQIEPDCTGTDCQGTCGDGIVSGEDCDDGNTQDGDGCSSTCTIESGYTCTAAACDKIGGTCVLHLPAVFRDFNSHEVTGGHPDFQPGFNSTGALQGLVEDLLDADGKPVQTTTLSASALATTAFMHGQAAFAQWYRDDPPSSGPIPGEIVLWDDGAGGYVNRWGKNGEQWTGYPNPDPLYCDAGCDTCGTPGPGQVCLEPCTLYSSTVGYSCMVTPTKYDGNPLFFPIDSAPGILSEPRSEGKVPEQYGYPGWPWETDLAPTLGITTPIVTATSVFPSTTHNYSFTTEVKFVFRYDSTQTQELSFLGDDDVWVFLNGHLAVDLGGWHVPLDATLTLDGGTVTAVTTITPTSSVKTKMSTAADFGLEDGKLYQIAVFHAERQVEGSSFKLGLRGLDQTKSTCVKN